MCAGSGESVFTVKSEQLVAMPTNVTVSLSAVVCGLIVIAGLVLDIPIGNVPKGYIVTSTLTTSCDVDDKLG